MQPPALRVLGSGRGLALTGEQSWRTRSLPAPFPRLGDAAALERDRQVFSMISTLAEAARAKAKGEWERELARLDDEAQAKQQKEEGKVKRA